MFLMPSHEIFCDDIFYFILQPMVSFLRKAFIDDVLSKCNSGYIFLWLVFISQLCFGNREITCCSVPSAATYSGWTSFCCGWIECTNWATKGAGTSDEKQGSNSKTVVELTNGSSGMNCSLVLF